MGLRESFQKLIEKKQDEIRDLEIRIREAQAYLQALQDSARLLPKEGVSAAGVKGAVTLRQGTELAKVREILLEAQKPLHVNAILDKMGKTVDQTTRVSLVGTLGSYSRKGRVFIRSAPNTFGLIEFDGSEKVGGGIEDEDKLPDDWGKF